MKKTYKKIKPLIEEELENTKMLDTLSKFTAIYLPLANSFAEDKIKNHEIFFLAFLTVYYVEEILEFQKEIDFLLDLPENKFNKKNVLKDFKKGLELIISKDMIAEGMELIMPLVSEISNPNSKYRKI